MKEKKRIISICITWMMVFSTFFGSFGMTAFAMEEHEGEVETPVVLTAAATSPQIVDYEVVASNPDMAEDESGQTITININFDRAIKIKADTDPLKELEILISGGDVKETNREISAEVNNQQLSIKMVSIADEFVAVYGGLLNINAPNGIKSIVSDDDSETPATWTDIETYLPIGIELTTEAAADGVKVSVTETAKMRGMYHFQVLDDGVQIFNDRGDEYVGDYYGGVLTSHAHNFITMQPKDYVNGMVNAINSALSGSAIEGDYFVSKSAVEVDSFTITGSATLSMRMFEFVKEDENGVFDGVVQKPLLKDAIVAAEESYADYISGADLKYTQESLDEIATAIADAKQALTDPQTDDSWKDYAELKAKLKTAPVEINQLLKTSSVTKKGTAELTFSFNKGDKNDWLSKINKVSIDGVEVTSTAGVVAKGTFSANTNAIVFHRDQFVKDDRGTYALKIEATGYAPLEKTITVNQYGAQTFQIRTVQNGVITPVKTYTLASMQAIAANNHTTTPAFYNAACGMAGVRTFKADGVLLTDLLKDAGVELKDGAKIQIRTNDSLESGSHNDSTTDNGYYSNGLFTYENLIKTPRYYFPGIYTNADIKQKILDAQRTSEDGWYPPAVREALAEDTTKQQVTPMLAWNYVETIFRTDQSDPANGQYDPLISEDRSFRFLFGLKMDESNPNIVSDETTTWSVTYCVFGIDIIYPDSSGGSSGNIHGGGGGGGGGSSSNSNSTSTSTNKETVVSVSADAKTESGKTTATVTAKQVKDTVEKAVAEAKKDGNKPVVKINVSGSSSTEQVETTIPKAALSAITSDINSLVISTSVGDITFDAKTLTQMKSGDSGDVKIIIKKADTNNLDNAAKKVIGDRPIIDITLSVGEKSLTSFGSGKLRLSIPYTAKSGEDTKKLAGYYVNGNVLEKMSNSAYDATNKQVSFDTTHLSTYAVGLDEQATTTTGFTDVKSTDWFAEYVNYLVGKGIVEGRTATTFAPNEAITRGEFVKIIASIAGMDPSQYTTTSFNDVKTTDWFAPYVAWANEKGIVTGFDGKFDPKGNISRQDMAVIINRYAASAADFSFPATVAATDFSDGQSIASYAKDAVTVMQKAGIISGRDTGAFAPTDSATRAEAAKMLTTLMKQMGK